MSVATFQFEHARVHPEHEEDVPLSRVPQREYICLWESPSMPGIIQIGRYQGDLAQAAWMLQSQGGAETIFRPTHYFESMRSHDVERRLREVFRSDAVPGQEGFFVTRRRFAIQTLEAEAEAAGTTLYSRHQSRFQRVTTWAFGAVALIVLAVVALVLGQSHPTTPAITAKAPAVAPARVEQAAAAQSPKAAPIAKKPGYRATELSMR